jgi:hypothetical protein
MNETEPEGPWQLTQELTSGSIVVILPTPRELSSRFFFFVDAYAVDAPEIPDQPVSDCGWILH